jgi:hypothetical protein
MTYLTKTLGKLSASHFLRCRSERLSLVDIEEGEGRPASPNLYETGNDLVSHGWQRWRHVAVWYVLFSVLYNVHGCWDALLGGYRMCLPLWGVRSFVDHVGLR